MHEVCFGWSNARAHAIWIQVVFLDDIGANLKPARDLGMVTILVRDSDMALQELEKVTGVQVTTHLCWVPYPASCLYLGTRDKTSQRRTTVETFITPGMVPS